MRFYKATEDIDISSYYQKGKVLKKGRIICFSKYFTCNVLISDGTEKTSFIWKYSAPLMEHILDGKLAPLTQKQLSKIRPHLRKEHFGVDLDK